MTRLPSSSIYFFFNLYFRLNHRQLTPKQLAHTTTAYPNPKLNHNLWSIFSTFSYCALCTPQLTLGY